MTPSSVAVDDSAARPVVELLLAGRAEAIISQADWLDVKRQDYDLSSSRGW